MNVRNWGGGLRKHKSGREVGRPQLLLLQEVRPTLRRLLPPTPSPIVRLSE